jgi:Domain of unknown function (DUF4157)
MRARISTQRDGLLLAQRFPGARPRGPRLAPDQQWILHLQRTAGNAAVVQLLSDGGVIQRCGPTPCDCSPAERAQAEAESPAVQRMAQRGPQASASGPAGGSLAPSLTTAIARHRGQGASLDASTRLRMERAFGTGFADVRVHIDSTADRLSRRLGAHAFTSGSDIFFRSGGYQSGSTDSVQRLAHELTHVVQQRSRQQQVATRVGNAGSMHEEEARGVAAAVAAGEAVHVAPALDDSLEAQRDADTCTYGEIRSWAVAGADDHAPAGLADAKESISAACSHGNACNCVDGSAATAPKDQHAWRNITNANGGADQSGGGNFMCVGSENCWFVHTCTACDGHGGSRRQARASNLATSGTTTVNGHTLYFYDDPMRGWCNHNDFVHGCAVHRGPRRHH